MTIDEKASAPPRAAAPAEAGGSSRSIPESRRRLPNRRWNRTQRIEWRGDAWQLCVGFDPATGRARELFCSGPHATSDLQALVDDSCVAISRCLQCGDAIAEIATSLGRESTDPAAPVASLLGLIAAEAAAIEIETENNRRKP